MNRLVLVVAVLLTVGCASSNSDEKFSAEDKEQVMTTTPVIMSCNGTNVTIDVPNDAEPCDPNDSKYVIQLQRVSPGGDIQTVPTNLFCKEEDTGAQRPGTVRFEWVGTPREPFVIMFDRNADPGGGGGPAYFASNGNSPINLNLRRARLDHECLKYDIHVFGKMLDPRVILIR